MSRAERTTGARAALTLVELLTSVSIALALCVLATVSFLQVRALLERMHTRLEMHNSARFVYQSLSEGLGSLQQDAALWLESTQDSGARDGMVQLTWLRGRVDEHGFTSNMGDIWGGEEFSVYQNRCTDLAWCGFKWDQKRGILYSGMNRQPHQFHMSISWSGPNGDYGGGNGPYFLYMPQPLRQSVPYPLAAPATSSQAALSGSRYGSPDTIDDISDYQDLHNQMAPIARNVSNCVIELVLADGTVVDGDVTQSRIANIDGCYVDGSPIADPNSGDIGYRKRPRLVRLLFDMTDPVNGVTQTFSFSFEPPGMLPATYPTGSSIP